MVDGEWIFVSGTTGYDYSRMTISADVIEQCEQAMRNVVTALAEAGAGIPDVVRVRYILPHRDDFELCWPTLRRHFGTVRPAATMIVAGLADVTMKFEVEVTARTRRVTPVATEREMEGPPEPEGSR